MLVQYVNETNLITFWVLYYLFNSFFLKNIIWVIIIVNTLANIISLYYNKDKNCELSRENLNIITVKHY